MSTSVTLGRNATHSLHCCFKMNQWADEVLSQHWYSESWPMEIDMLDPDIRLPWPCSSDGAFHATTAVSGHTVLRSYEQKCSILRRSGPQWYPQAFQIWYCTVHWICLGANASCSRIMQSYLFQSELMQNVFAFLCGTAGSNSLLVFCSRQDAGRQKPVRVWLHVPYIDVNPSACVYSQDRLLSLSFNSRGSLAGFILFPAFLSQWTLYQ